MMNRLPLAPSSRAKWSPELVAFVNIAFIVFSCKSEKSESPLRLLVDLEMLCRFPSDMHMANRNFFHGD